MKRITIKFSAFFTILFFMMDSVHAQEASCGGARPAPLFAETTDPTTATVNTVDVTRTMDDALISNSSYISSSCQASNSYDPGYSYLKAGYDLNNVDPNYAYSSVTYTFSEEIYEIELFFMIMGNNEGSPDRANIRTYDIAGNEIVSDLTQIWECADGDPSRDLTVNPNTGTNPDIFTTNDCTYGSTSTNDINVKVSNATTGIKKITIYDVSINAELYDNCNDGYGFFVEICPLSISNQLPINLQSFNVEAINSDAKIYWTTASEKENSHFELQFSRDGNDFENVENLMTQADENGNSHQELKYVFTHNNASQLADGLYYRLKQVDLNGDHSFSKVQYVSFDLRARDVKVYPNPVSKSSFVTIEGNNINSIELFNNFGNLVRTIANHNQDNYVHIDTQNLIPGLYLVRINDNETYKLMVQN